MKIATTTEDFGFYFDSYEDQIKELHRAGFRYVDLNMYGFTPDSPYMNDGWQDKVKALKDCADSLGMELVQAHSQGGNPLSDDQSHVDFLIKATLRSIEICGILGIKNTVVHNGMAEGLSKEEWFVKNKAFYKKLIPTAERCGVNILCENSTASNMGDKYFINTGRDMREFIEYVGHPMIHGCWDTGHARVQYGARENEALLIAGERVICTHIHDNYYNQDLHGFPFTGNVDWKTFMTTLKKIGYQGDLSFEFVYDRLPKALAPDYMKILYKTGEYLLHLSDE